MWVVEEVGSGVGRGGVGRTRKCPPLDCGVRVVSLSRGTTTPYVLGEKITSF